ncbi:hypothetical protein EDB81DRAFT_353539 [Dactylonectria macrodidyma]|uniref:Uncharacterized protein n=1 Tax=Dactylonectria macrodidyma TaxID=307937 RepID=A0A9P9JK64_9HYPO|nr:hypothetical protein EDB81DRAFT_353539 [Dactylonectria macrodidyma]
MGLRSGQTSLVLFFFQGSSVTVILRGIYCLNRGPLQRRLFDGEGPFVPDAALLHGSWTVARTSRPLPVHTSYIRLILVRDIRASEGTEQEQK